MRRDDRGEQREQRVGHVHGHEGTDEADRRLDAWGCRVVGCVRLQPCALLWP